MFAALGWNVWNNPPQPRHLREVVVENRTEIKGRTGRVDYLFRTGGLERWIAHFYRLGNQGDARVIPQIKATKLLEVPMPKWDQGNLQHKEVVSLVRSLLKLTGSNAPGTARTSEAQRRSLDEMAAAIYGVTLVETPPA
jgi:hypothetical protein